METHFITAENRTYAPRGDHWRCRKENPYCRTCYPKPDIACMGLCELVRPFDDYVLSVYPSLRYSNVCNECAAEQLRNRFDH